MELTQSLSKPVVAIALVLGATFGPNLSSAIAVTGNQEISCVDLDTVARANSAIKRNRNDATAYVCRARAHLNRRNYRGALADLSRAIKLRPDDKAMYVERSRAYFVRKDFKRSLADLDKAIVLSPDVLTLVERSNVHAMMKNLDGAVGDLDQALKLSPASTELHVMRGQLYFEFDEFVSAEESFNRAVQLAPNNAAARKGRGAARTKQSQLALAMADFQSALKINPRDPEVHYLLALSTLRFAIETPGNDGARFAEALKSAQQAIELRPDYFDAILLRANIYLVREEYAEAVESVDAAIVLDSRRAEAYSLRSRIHLDNRDFKRASADVRRAIKLDRKLAEPYCVRASISAEGNRTAAAIKDFDACLKLAKDRDMREWASYELNALRATAN